MEQKENKKYNIRDFNNWLESNPSRKEKANWGINQAIIDGRIEFYHFNNESDISQITPSLTWGEDYIKVLKKWIKIQERENDEVKIEKIWNILFDKNIDYDYKKLFDELEDLKDSAISLQVRKKQQQLIKLREKLMDEQGKKMLNFLVSINQELNKEINELKKAKLEGKKEILEEFIKENIQNELINQIIFEETELICLQEQIAM